MKKVTYLKMKFYKRPAVIINILAMAILAACSSSPYEEITVMRGEFRQSFSETGELAAIKAEAILMPPVNYRYGYEFKIIDMVDTGSRVNKGDTIVVLDPSTIEKFIISTQEALDNENAAATKQAVEIENSIQELQAQLRTEEASYNLKKLELDRGIYDAENKRRIKELEFQQATIRIDKVKRKLRMKPLLNEFDRRIQEIKVLQKQDELKGAIEALDMMSVTCPVDGLFQVGKSMFNYPPQDLKVGDAVYREGLIASIPDIEFMKVNTFVNEADFTKVKIGTKVIVRMDALPSVPFNGVVTQLSKLCVERRRGNEKERVFNVVVEIKESDLRLKPGMTVSCEYICYESDDEMYVPNKCLLKEEGRAYVFLEKGGKPQKIEVGAGPSNNSHTVIFSDLRPGQRLIAFENVLTQKNL